MIGKNAEEKFQRLRVFLFLKKIGPLNRPLGVPGLFQFGLFQLDRSTAALSRVNDVDSSTSSFPETFRTSRKLVFQAPRAV